MNQKNNGLIAAFVKKTEIVGFLTQLYDNYAISPIKVFVYDIQDNPEEYLTTFKVFNKAKALNEIKHATIVHVKHGCVFSINALNKLIEQKKQDDTVDNLNVQLNWDEYSDQLMMIKYGKLNITPIKKIETKDLIFKN